MSESDLTELYNLPEGNMGAMQKRLLDADNQIKDIMLREKELYNKLEALNSQNAPTTDILSEEQRIIDIIDDLSKTRIELYEEQRDMYTYLQQTVSETRNNLVDQNTLVNVLDEETKKAGEDLESLTEIKNNKMRLVELNTYYAKQYNAKVALIKNIIYICIPLIIIAILMKYNILPPKILTILLWIIIIIGGFFILRGFLDLSYRDNMKFDEYNWGFNEEANKPTVSEYNKKHMGWDSRKLLSNLYGECIGEFCCDKGMEFSSINNKCQVPKGENIGSSAAVIT